ncbi:glycosyltransferase, partial [Geomonas sp.]|uniref:glycosyltransferase n=1 Tax=Geomonas sp. TaxID=2651584 RepID=UPI002B47AD17
MPSSGKQRITVLYVVTGLATGGAELMLLKLLTVIKERGIDPVVVSLMDEGTVGRKLAAIDVPVLTLNIRAKAFPLAALLDLRRMIRTVAPDLIQGWMYHGNIAATVGQWLSVGKRPVLWSVHHSLDDIGKEKRLTRLLIGLGARLSSSTAAVHYCSATSALQHEGIGFCKARSTVIPNGFDCLAFSPDPSLRLKIRRELAIGEDVLVVGHVARYHPIKDHGNFLAAAARLNREGVRACFVLSGAGVSWDNDELRALIGQHALQDRVFLLGERGDVPALMNAFDIYVSSSWSEAFPIAVGEAMACGTPCIATDVGDSAL